LFDFCCPLPTKTVGAEGARKEKAKMEANALGSITGSGKSSAATAASKAMGKDAFLTLLITQLQHQDPLNPTDSTEFTAQLAQFSSLEQLSNVNENLNTLKLYQASINNAQAVSFIGKNIVSKGKTLPVTSGQPAACEFELSADAKRVVVSIYDAAGSFVKDIQATALKAGKQSLSWDGKDRNGNTVADGSYSFEVQAESASGEKVGVTTYSKGTVTGVTFEDGVTYLIVGRTKVAIGDVTQVSQGPAPTAS
jgi:flagellar basal-body rod modification protein FlgD